MNAYAAGWERRAFFCIFLFALSVCQPPPTIIRHFVLTSRPRWIEVAGCVMLFCLRPFTTLCSTYNMCEQAQTLAAAEKVRRPRDHTNPRYVDRPNKSRASNEMQRSEWHSVPSDSSADLNNWTKGSQFPMRSASKVRTLHSVYKLKKSRRFLLLELIYVTLPIYSDS